MCANHLAAFGMPAIGFLILAGLVAILLLFFVHRMLNRICLVHVKRYCGRHGIEISEWRIYPEVDQRGRKTETTQIEIISSGTEDGRTVYRFVVWLFGIKNVGESPFNPDEEGG